MIKTYVMKRFQSDYLPTLYLDIWDNHSQNNTVLEAVAFFLGKEQAAQYNWFVSGRNIKLMPFLSVYGWTL